MSPRTSSRRTCSKILLESGVDTHFFLVFLGIFWFGNVTVAEFIVCVLEG